MRTLEWEKHMLRLQQTAKSDQGAVRKGHCIEDAKDLLEELQKVWKETEEEINGRAES